MMEDVIAVVRRSDRRGIRTGMALVDDKGTWRVKLERRCWEDWWHDDEVSGKGRSYGEAKAAALANAPEGAWADLLDQLDNEVSVAEDESVHM